MPSPIRTAALVLSLALTAACKGADGAAGPAGVPGPQGPAGAEGPGTRITFTGTIDANGTGAAQLPAAAGSAVNLPAIGCYVSDDGQTWLVVAFDSSAEIACAVTAGAGGLVAGVIGAPPGWRYTIVVVY